MNWRRLCAVAAVSLLVVSWGLPQGSAYAGLPFSIDVQVGAPTEPPEINYAEPPALVVVPGTDLYVAPDVDGDLAFYQGYWWRLYNGDWYLSPSYSGPWHYMDRDRVPPVIYELPPDFRYNYRSYHHLNHEEVERNWQRWENEHHWQDRDDRQYRDEHRDWNDHDRYNEQRNDHDRYNEQRGDHDRYNEQKVYHQQGQSNPVSVPVTQPTIRKDQAAHDNNQATHDNAGAVHDQGRPQGQTKGQPQGEAPWQDPSGVVHGGKPAASQNQGQTKGQHQGEAPWQDPSGVVHGGKSNGEQSQGN